jgi:dolichol-phosphate mannosyltransferase
MSRLAPRASLLTLARVVAAAAVLRRVAMAARRGQPLGPAPLDAPLPTISIVVPARDEAARIGPLLDALLGAPGVAEVLVVDDESSDDTAAVAAAAGARVLPGRVLPAGWAGKAWALQQGLEAATGDWIVMLDADTRPSPDLPQALVARALADRIDLVSVGGRFECPTPGVAWLHPAMLTTLVYRFGPAGSTARMAPSRVLANGQCMAAPRERLLAAGGLSAVGGQVVEDVALARHLAAQGWAVAMLDGAALLSTRMFEDLGHTWRGWARSLALPGVEPLLRQVLDLAGLVLAQALPVLRLVARRADVVDFVLLVTRLGTLGGTAPAYALPRRAHRVAYALSPLADPVAVTAVAVGVARPLLGRRHTWRGRTYG